MDRLGRLLDLADRYDIAVMFCVLRGDLLACWVPSMRRIFVSSRLTDEEQEVQLAHELGHAHHGHPCAKHPTTPSELARERQADRFAARLLIDPAHYAVLEAVNPDQHQLAEELGVPVKLIYIFEEDCLTRVAGATYAHAREGIGQWAHRVEVA